MNGMEQEVPHRNEGERFHMSPTSTVRVERTGPIGVLTLTSQRPLTVLDTGMLRELGAVFTELRSMLELRALILTGEGKAFAAGADIRELLTFSPAEAAEFSRLGNTVFTSIERHPIPVIAAVNGFAFGGGLELALCADFLYASSTARFALPEVTLGVIPGFGGCRRLAERIGMHHARELAYTGRIIGADEALRLGLANRIADPSELLPGAMAAALEIAAASGNAVREVKHLLGAFSERSAAEFAAMEIEKFGSVFRHEDAGAGLSAFIAKVKPVWKEEA